VRIYDRWLKAVQANPSCAGWVIWRLVARQDSGDFPQDVVDGFDIKNDNSPLWHVVRDAAMRGRIERRPQ
jgi:mannan endo-1,4-beta-mannosidase